MGFINKLFSKLKDKKSKKADQPEGKKSVHGTKSVHGLMEEQEVTYENEKDIAGIIKTSCEQILEASKQLDEMKMEYQAVTSYLSDMQRIELIPQDDRNELNDVAKKIVNRAKERAKFKNNTRKITDIQYKNIAQYEDTMPTELKKMMKNEAYNSTVKKDMHYLEGEKGALNFQKEEALLNQSYLKKIAAVICVMVAGLFILFYAVKTVYDADILIPFLLTVLMILVSALYISTKSAENRKSLKETEMKINKAISLLNKVKIKYINNTSELDYTYEKYMVNSYAELNYLWEQYIKARDDERRYDKNTQEWEYYNEKLVKLLKDQNLSDPDIWIYQTNAILDSKEMVEVRHRLNMRRQKLRERIDYNNSVKERCSNEIAKYISYKPENSDEVMKLLKKYKIEL